MKAKPKKKVEEEEVLDSDEEEQKQRVDIYNSKEIEYQEEEK